MSSRDVVCLSHLPWTYALERPHQVMRRFARDRQVFFVEQPTVTDAEMRTVMKTVAPNVHVVSLYVPADMGEAEVAIAHRQCVSALAADTERPILWVYAPDALPAARDLESSLLVYDCVADHAARRDATAAQRANEMDLLVRADLVLTAGTSLFEAKRAHNVSTYPLPSSVEAECFAPSVAPGATRDGLPPAPDSGPRDLGKIPSPRVGFLGVIDDRVDLALVDHVAGARPDLQLVLLGGLVGTTTWDLPDRPNVHWLGAKDNEEIARHVATWDVAMMPYRSDAATRRAEPSGLLACVAAGKPIVSTPLDEIGTLADRGLVRVTEPERFIGAIDQALVDARNPAATALRRLAREAVLGRTSWDRTTSAMLRLVDEAVMTRRLVAKRRESERVLRSA